ncbi:MAG: tetratricopeptide repeat protein [Anaerolineae bacterium]
MKCPNCGNDNIPEDVHVCPECGEEIQKVPRPSPAISVDIDAENIKDAASVIGVKIGEYKANFEQGSVVNQHIIVNNTMEFGPEFLEALMKALIAHQHIDKVAVQDLGTLPLPENVNDQIEQITAAQKEVAARGIPISAQALCHLGRLAASRRQYEEALSYFRQATQADPQYSDAYEAIVGLQQSRAMQDIQARNYDAAMSKLAEARTAAMHTDPLDPEALALRGYIAKTLAQIYEARGNLSERQTYYDEAARFFSHVVQLDPNNAAAHNGLGNVEYARGNLDRAIAAYRRAVELIPYYTAAYHDLALTFEGKMEAEPQHRNKWCKEALRAWREAYRLAPNDHTFSERDVVRIGQQILWLEQQCP